MANVRFPTYRELISGSVAFVTGWGRRDFSGMPSDVRLSSRLAGFYRL
jgi:hypothetical protein